MSLVRSLALHTLHSFPPSVQTRILRDSGFQEKIGLNGTVAPFDDVGRILLGDILDSARQVYETGTPLTIKNLDGENVVLELRDSYVVMSKPGKAGDSTGATHADVALVSPNPSARLKVLETITRKFRSTGPDPKRWRKLLTKRPPTNVEIEELHNEIADSVPNWLVTVQEQIDSGNLTPLDLVPEHSGYFEALCGPVPETSTVDEYVSGPLQQHRKTLLARDLSDGLLHCLPGNLRADASPVPLLQHLSDKEVWDIVDGLPPLNDPFSLLGLIEIAIARREGLPDFHDMAADLIAKLCDKVLPRHDGKDIYVYYPALVGFVLHRLRAVEGLATQPPYWHWLCAFTHAGVVMRLLDGLDFEASDMSRWLNSNENIRDRVGDLLAIRSEPTWRFDQLSREHIRAELMGRLQNLANLETRVKRNLPNRKVIEKSIKQLSQRGFSYFFPGPLEGSLRPKNLGPDRDMPTEQIKHLQADLEENEAEFPWAGLANTSSTFTLPGELRQNLADRVSTFYLPGQTVAKQIGSLAFLALVAAIHEDEILAAAIVERAFQELNDVDEVQAAFFLLLIASAAIPNDSWPDWLAERLMRLAFTVPLGQPVTALRRLLCDLKHHLPIEQWKFGRAEALCIAAGSSKVLVHDEK